MKKDEKLTSVKRFGTRYGRTMKLKFGKIETEQRKKHKCPYCDAFQVKRLSAGIWECRKCHIKFSGRAYTLVKKQADIIEPAEHAPEEAEQEEPQEEEQQEA